MKRPRDAGLSSLYPTSRPWAILRMCPISLNQRLDFPHRKNPPEKLYVHDFQELSARRDASDFRSRGISSVKAVPLSGGVAAPQLGLRPIRHGTPGGYPRGPDSSRILKMLCKRVKPALGNPLPLVKNQDSTPSAFDFGTFEGL
jgi:hypothetical protein